MVRKALTSLTYDAQPISGTPSPSVGVSWTTKRGSGHIMYQRLGVRTAGSNRLWGELRAVNGTPGSPHWTGLYRAKEQMSDDARRIQGTARSRVATLDGGSTGQSSRLSGELAPECYGDTSHSRFCSRAFFLPPCVPHSAFSHGEPGSMNSVVTPNQDNHSRTATPAYAATVHKSQSLSRS